MYNSNDGGEGTKLDTLLPILVLHPWYQYNDPCLGWEGRWDRSSIGLAAGPWSGMGRVGKAGWPLLGVVMVVVVVMMMMVAVAVAVVAAVFVFVVAAAEAEA